MPGTRLSRALAAGTEIASMLTDSEFETVSEPSVVTIAAVKAIDAGTAEITIQHGSRVMRSAGIVAAEAAANRGPSLEDDVLSRDIAFPGEKIIIRARETGGVTATSIIAQVVINPIPRG